MRCSSCDSESAEGNFCDVCGARMADRCPNCGAVNRSVANFCRDCGARLVATANAHAVTATILPSTKTDHPAYASSHVIAEERKRLTVLFADIRGSTAFIEKLDPEEVRKHFDPVLQVMMDAVRRYGGTVNQVLGDGIMALFGAPMAHEDHAVRACYAALAMQEEMRRSSAKDQETSGQSLRIGIGLNSGEVVVRSVSNDLNFDYSALGQTTHLAARMESLAAPGKVLISATTWQDAEGFIEVKSLGLLPIKGFSSAVEAFELVGVTAARSRLQAAATRGLTTFVGRQGEIDLVHKLIRQIAVGQGQMLALVGEAGIGKSRLIRHCLADSLSAELMVLEGPAVSYGKTIPYFPLVRLLRSYFGVSEADEPDHVRAKIIEQMISLDGALNDWIPAIFALLGVLPRASASDLERQTTELARATVSFANAEPQDRRRRTFDALTRLLLSASHRQPLVAIFEDLHWIDSDSQAFLNELVDKLAHGRILLWVTYRPGYSHSWANHGYYNRLRLTPLPAPDAGQLLDVILGAHSELTKLKEILARRTAGNPFFVEESIRALVEAGVLVGTRGDYRPAVLIESVRIPNTVQTVLAERIDRLAAEEKELLQGAAVIGAAIPDRLLRAASELAEERFRSALATLKSSEFLVETSLYPEVEYRFTHALISEVTYNALLHDKRVALHARTLTALESISAEQPLHWIETLADHAYRAESWRKAAIYLRQAGNKAMSHSAFGAAMMSYERAFNALSHLEQSDAKLEQQIDLHLDWRNVLFLRGELSRVGEHLGQAEVLAEQLGDQRRLARVLNFQNGYYGLAGDPERAIEAGRRALELPVTQQDVALLTVTRYYTGVAYNRVAQYDRAATILRSGISSVQGDLKFARFGTAAILSVMLRSHLIQSLALTGGFEEGIERAREAVEIAEQAQHTVSLIHLQSSLGFLHLLKGDFAAAVPILEGALALCAEKQISIYVPLVTPRLGYAYFNVDRQEEGLRLMEESIEDSANVGRAAFRALTLTWLAEAYLAAGRFNDAQSCAQQAIDLAKQNKEPGHGALAFKVYADIAAQHAPEEIEQTETSYRRALELACSMGMRPLQAHCHAGLARLYLAVGACDLARRESEAASGLYRATAMTAWQVTMENNLTRLG
jgi:class 3 adenylate cyclase/tetratricopeptide (TPR) repeat protein